MEIMVVVAIIGILAAILIPSLLGHAERGRSTAAEANLGRMGQAVELYWLDQGRHRVALSEFTPRPSNVKTWPAGGRLREVQNDPRGHEYLMKVPGDENRPFESRSRGADGQAGGEGANADHRCFPPPDA